MKIKRHPAPLFKVNTGLISMLSTDSFIMPEKIQSLVDTSKKYFPIFFVSNSTTEILDDSPVMGAWEYGKLTLHSIEGPFATLREAEEKRKELSGQKNLRGEFTGRVITRFIEEDIDPASLVLQTYIYQHIKIGKITTERIPYYDERHFLQISDEQIDALSERLFQRARKFALKTKEIPEKNSLIVIIKKDNYSDFVELNRKINEHYGNPYFELRSFSSFPNPHNLLGDLIDLKIPANAESDLIRPYISMKPIDFSFDKYISIDDILKDKNLV